MEIITQILPNEDELLTVPSNMKERFVCEPETYGYFLALFEQEIDEFISQRTGLQPPNREAGMQAHFDWQRVRIKNLKSFNRGRAKYHLYQGRVYGYNPMIANVGHEVEAYRLSDSEIVNVLNALSVSKEHAVLRTLNRLLR